jgi:hypothetical protein
MSDKRTPRWSVELGAWTHDALVILCVAGILLAVAILLFGGFGGCSGTGGGATP